MEGDLVMGMEFTIDNLEDMCDLMCFNRIPKRRTNMKVFNPPKHGYINDNGSRLYPGCEVNVLAYIESTDQYQVQSVETGYECDVSFRAINIDKE